MVHHDGQNLHQLFIKMLSFNLVVINKFPKLFPIIKNISVRNSGIGKGSCWRRARTLVMLRDIQELTTGHLDEDVSHLSLLSTTV